MQGYVEEEERTFFAFNFVLYLIRNGEIRVCKLGNDINITVLE